MQHFYLVRNRKVVAGLTVLAIVAALGVAWVERTTLLAWYHVRGLAGSSEAERDVRIERVLGLGDKALPSLVSRLHGGDSLTCANVQAALCRYAECSGMDEARGLELVRRLAEAFPSLGAPGQQAALEVALVIAAKLPEPAAEPLARILTGAAVVQDSEVHAKALELVAVMEEPRRIAILTACQDVIRASLKGQSAANRVRAVQLAQQPELNLLRHVVPLLGDPNPEVRQAVILAVGPAPETVGTDDLLRWLHDPDADVRHLCETALRGRGLRDEHVRLGRLMTDARPHARLQVLDLLRRAEDLEPITWLRRLSHDPAPAVRAAAMRAATEQADGTLRDRIEQMAQDDPSPTVRQLARYYLASPKSISR